jgi:hypothetical protein
MVHVVSPLRTPSTTNNAVARRQIPAAVTDTTSDPVADFRSLFTPKPSSSTATTPPAAQAPSPSPTAESVFGASPWLSNPSGTGPTGSYGYNPFYFASPDTAAKVAQMVGGTVVQSNQFTGNGGVFTQSQPNQMVQLANGKMVNPGLIASFYTHGYPQSYVDQLVANEVNNA